MGFGETEANVLLHLSGHFSPGNDCLLWFLFFGSHVDGFREINLFNGHRVR